MTIKIITITLIFSSYSIASTISKRVAPKSDYSLTFSTSLKATASSDLETKLDLFDSKKISDIEEGFEKSLDAPTIGKASFEVGFGINENQFSYERKYLAMAQAQNPVFPRLKLTQYNDHRLSYSRKTSWNKLTMTPKLGYVIRKAIVDIKKLEDFLADDFEFDAEAGEQSNHLSFSSEFQYEINNKHQFLGNIQSINIGNSVVNEKYYEFGVSRVESIPTRFSNFDLKANLLNTSLELWKATLSADYSIIDIDFESNNFGDFNQSYALKALGFSLSYFKREERSPLFVNQSANVWGVFLGYSNI